MARRTVGEIRSLVVEMPPVLRSSGSLRDVAGLMGENPLSRHVYIVDDDERLQGSVRLHDLIETLFPYLLVGEISEEDLSPLDLIFDSPATRFINREHLAVTEDTTLAELIPMMIENFVNELPVIDATGRVIGEVNMLEILKSLAGRE